MFKRLCVLGVAAWLAASPAWSASSPLKVQRLDDTTIDAWIDPPPTAGKAPILLQFQGSSCLAVGPNWRGLLPISAPGAVRLAIEKYGLSVDVDPSPANCPRAYLDHNTIDQRVSDALTVLAALRANAPWWDGRLVVTGVSEGATIAALVGGFAAETRGIVLINGSIGEPFREGWVNAMVAQSPPDKADAVRAQAHTAWAQIRADPTPAKTVFGPTNTQLWWSSILDKRPANLLLLGKTPLLVLQSEKDQMTPLASATALNDRFKAAGRGNFTFETLPGLDHGFKDASGAVRADVPIRRASDWIRAVLSP